MAFKNDTDDIRNAPSIPTIEKLLKKGVLVSVYDPNAIENARGILGNKVKYCKNIDSALEAADICIIMTEWGEFKNLDVKVFKEKGVKVIIGGRNILGKEKFKKSRIVYRGIGR